MGVCSRSEAFRKKCLSAEEAVGRIRSGQRVFIGTGCALPRTLVRELIRQSPRLADVEIIHLPGRGILPFSRIAEESQGDRFTLRSFFSGSAARGGFSKNRRFLSPVPLSAVPRLFHKRLLTLHVALIQVSPPDEEGWMSLGISVDVTLAAARAAELVIAQVNPRMPRVGGQGVIHVDEVDILVEQTEELITLKGPPVVELARAIGRQAAPLIEDGATLHLGLGIVPQTAPWALEGKKDLGIHTSFLNDAALHLFRMGVITNRFKETYPGKTVACGAIGSRELFDFLDRNPLVEFHPADQVCDPLLIAKHARMVAVHEATAVDLTGQVRFEASAVAPYSGTLEVLDFLQGAAAAERGISIFLLPSTERGGKRSRILARLNKGLVGTTGGEVHFVVTEFGAAHLFGKTIEERALALIGIAHPDFRASLFDQAKALGLLGRERTFLSAYNRVYPQWLEEERTVAGQSVFFRPVKPSDERLIQEHFYQMDPEDVAARFFQEKTIFPRRDLTGLVPVDYENEMTLVAVLGPPGFERVIGVGAYFRLSRINAVEAAFSVLKPWQRKGIGTVLLQKLALAAERQGVSAFMVYTRPQNLGMIRLFQKMPHPVTTTYEEDLLLLSCRLDENP